MSVSSINVSNDAVELSTCRISLMIPFIEIGEDAEELATDRISSSISFHNNGDEYTVALPIDMI
jgi:hypothetical protein